jgi:hypothetical protein
MEATMRLSGEQLAAVREIVERSPVIGLGNPKVTKYPMTRRECRETREGPHLRRRGRRRGERRDGVH